MAWGRQRGSISLSHAAAVGQTTAEQIAEAKTKADPNQIVDLEELIAKSHEAEATRQSFRQLCAPPSAQKRRDKLRTKGKLGEIPGLMVAKLRKREAKPPKKYEPTASEPTSERRQKEAHGFETILHAGGQVSHKARVFVEVFDRHIPEHLREAFALLQRGYEIAQRSRSTSSRAYTGAPYTGQSPDHEGHVALTDNDRRDLELWGHAWQNLIEQTPEWGERLKAHVLRVADERNGHMQTVAELGASRTNYAIKTDNATAAGVMGVLDAGLRWMEALQAAAMKLQYARMYRRAVFEEEAARYALGARERDARDRKSEKEQRVEQYYRQITKKSGAR